MFAVFWSYSVALSVAAVILLYKYGTRTFDYWKKRNVFYYRPLPFLGNMLPTLTLKKTMGEWLGELYRTVDDDYFGIFAFGRPVLLVKSPRLVKSILLKDFSHFEDRTVTTPASDKVMENIMFFQKNPGWKTVRAKMTPVFTSGKLKAMFPLILRQGQDMNAYIEKFASGPTVEAKEICSKYSTNVIARCAFAVDAQSFEDHNAEFRKIGRQMFDFRLSTAFRQYASWFMPQIVTKFQMAFFESSIVSSLKRIFLHVLHARMESNDLKGNDLVDILLEAGRKGDKDLFCENMLLSQAIQFFAAGFETVSATLSFAIYELSIHKEIQEKLRREIMENVEKNQGITYDGVQEMKYLDLCTSEILRKYPVLPFLDRICKEDYKVPNSDLTIEKGTAVYIPMFGLHYDPKYFPDPQKFDPERFADKTAINRDGFYYIPFGDGPRVCIGNRFGLMTVKIGLVCVLSQYRLLKTKTTPIPMKFEPKSFLLQSKVGIPVKFAPI